MSSKSVIVPKRRRGQALETALLEAAWQELRTVGYHKLTFDNVALRAGTSKTVLYRRWANRLELVRATLRAHRPLISGIAPDTGSLRGDVLAVLERIASRLHELQPDIVWGMLSDAISDTDQHNFLYEQVTESNTAIMLAVLQQAQARGEIATVDLPQRIITLPLDLARHEMLITGRPATKAAITQIVDGIYMPLLKPGHT